MYCSIMSEREASGDVGYRLDTSQSIQSLQAARDNCLSVPLSDFCILPCIEVHLKPKCFIEWKTEGIRQKNFAGVI